MVLVRLVGSPQEHEVEYAKSHADQPEDPEQRDGSFLVRRHVAVVVAVTVTVTRSWARAWKVAAYIRHRRGCDDDRRKKVDESPHRLKQTVLKQLISPKNGYLDNEADKESLSLVPMEDVHEDDECRYNSREFGQRKNPHVGEHRSIRRRKRLTAEHARAAYVNQEVSDVAFAVIDNEANG